VKLKSTVALLACCILTVVAVPPSQAAVSAATPTTYPVASVNKTFIDTSRSTPANGHFRGSSKRKLETLILYPQQPTGQHRKFPLIVFSHGFTAKGSFYAPFLSAWAAHGYVIAAPNFPLSSANAPGGPTIVDYANQPGDVSFVITKVVELNNRRSSPLAGLINVNSIGVVGHSLGAITTLGVADNSCCQDPRISAAVTIAGLELPFPGGTYFVGHDAPLLLIHGTADQTIGYSSSQTLFADAQAPKFFLTLQGAPHSPFFDPWAPVITNTVLAFLDHYLGHDEGTAQIRKAGTVPGVSSIQIRLGQGRQAAA
jgi:predicted dienelactone hydrolase